MVTPELGSSYLLKEVWPSVLFMLHTNANKYQKRKSINSLKKAEFLLTELKNCNS